MRQCITNVKKAFRGPLFNIIAIAINLDEILFHNHAYMTISSENCGSIKESQQARFELVGSESVKLHVNINSCICHKILKYRILSIPGVLWNSCTHVKHIYLMTVILLHFLSMQVELFFGTTSMKNTKWYWFKVVWIRTILLPVLCNAV